MLQSRKTPYRTHTLDNLSEVSSLPPGRYAGRVLEVEQVPPSACQQIWIFLESSYFRFQLNRNEPLQAGELITFDLDTSGRITVLEHLVLEDTPHDRSESTLAHTVANPTQQILERHSDNGVNFQNDAYRWRQIGKSPPRMLRLKQRHRLIQQVRDYFDALDFLEVDTPTLVPTPNPEAHFDLLSTADDFLITSPEFQMKRMLVGGFEKIYQITSCFRGKEIGTHHNPEFTLLEWYRAFDRLDTLAVDLEQLFTKVAKVSSQVTDGYLIRGASQIDLSPPWPKRSVFELFEEHLHLDISTLQTADELKAMAISQGYGESVDEVPEHYEQVFFRLWDRFETQLGHEAPLLVYDWPRPLASLAQQRVDLPNTVERLELYIAGMEMANGFGELTHATEQRRRFEEDLDYRQVIGKAPVPLDEVFLNSLEQGMPPSSGMALGIDRLAMLFTGASHIREVLCFAWDER